MIKKESEGMFKCRNFNIFRCNPNHPNFALFKFIGEINLYILKLRKKSGK